MCKDCGKKDVQFPGDKFYCNNLDRQRKTCEITGKSTVGKGNCTVETTESSPYLHFCGCKGA